MVAIVAVCKDCSWSTFQPTLGVTSWMVNERYRLLRRLLPVKLIQHQATTQKYICFTNRVVFMFAVYAPYETKQLCRAYPTRWNAKRTTCRNINKNGNSVVYDESIEPASEQTKTVSNRVMSRRLAASNARQTDVVGCLVVVAAHVKLVQL